jgi:hypothetical protein
MKRLIARLVAATLIIPALTISFALPTFAQQTPIVKKVVLLPFHSVIQGIANVTPTGPCTLANSETGSGNAIHLGLITWSDTETVQFLSCPPPGSAIAVTGNFKIVAANGDEIDGTFETTGTLDSINGVDVQGPYKFLSGTGRFSNVTGSGVIAAHGPPGPPFDFVGSLDGVISY